MQARAGIAGSAARISPDPGFAVTGSVHAAIAACHANPVTAGT